MTVDDTPRCRTCGGPDDHVHVVRQGVPYVRSKGTRRLAPINHGTRSGYQQHVKRGQMPPCDDCKNAAAEAMAARRASYRAAPAVEPPRRVRPPDDPAVAILAHRHATELQAIRLALATRQRRQG